MIPHNHHLTILILAAGLGKRMVSPQPKVLLPLEGKPILAHILSTIQDLNPNQVGVVVGLHRELIQNALKESNVTYIVQSPPLGTGHAVQCAKSLFSNIQGSTLVLPGDCPLISNKTLNHLIKTHEKSNSLLTLLTAMFPETPTGYGRIIEKNGKTVAVVEEKDASLQQKRIHKINTGMYCFENTFLARYLQDLTDQNAQKEFYLPDLVKIAHEQNGLAALEVKDYHEVLGVNTPLDLEQISRSIHDNPSLIPHS